MGNPFRRFKAAYAFYNFFHRKELMRNERLYKKFGLKKKYYSPISSKDFEHLETPKQEKQEIEKLIVENSLFKSLDESNQKSIREYDDNGFIIIKNYLSKEEVQNINSEIEDLLSSKKIQFKNGNKLMFVLKQSKLLQSIGHRKELKEFLSILLNGAPMLFQSINFIKGSEQHTHSDSIHMTTWPLGGLLGVWFALEDIDEENGPLHYYPGSHKLPYYLNKDYDNEGSKFFMGKKTYDEYENFIESKIKEKGIQKKIFKAQAGDMLIWHANLLHGGDAMIDKNRTRKSMVFHYYRENSICYHEITQRPALIKDYA